MTIPDSKTPGRSMQAHLAQALAAAMKDVSLHRHDGEPAAALADALLLDAVRERATDIHFEPQSCGLMVRLRIDGRLHDAILLSSGEGAHIVRHFKAIGGLDSSQHFVPCTSRVTRTLDDRAVDLRLSSMPGARGEALTVRILDRTQASQRLEQLGLPPTEHRQVKSSLANAFGMFLAAGPSGSGKTTTLYALLHELRDHERATFTIEDPIEYEIDGITQTQVDRHHNLSFAEGLRAMLRLDTDYLLLGEIREPEAARAAIEAAACGRMLLSTIHSTDAVGVVTTLRSLGVSDLEIASSLHIVVAQRLVRRLCPHCRREVTIAPASQNPASGLRPTWESTGCDECHQLGYIGRIGLFEVWKPNEADRALILAHADAQAIRTQLAARGFRTIARDGSRKARQGLTSLAEVRQAVASYPDVPHRSANGRIVKLAMTAEALTAAEAKRDRAEPHREGAVPLPQGRRKSQRPQRKARGKSGDARAEQKRPRGRSLAAAPGA